MRTWLFLDVSNLCHRAFHAIPGMTKHGVPTAVTYGFLRDVDYYTRKFRTDDVVFCFDSKTSHREKEFPQYKETRRKLKETMKQNSPEEYSVLTGLYQQINLLRTDYLPSIGFRNVLHEEGLEADDIIASLCLELEHQDQAIIVSTDKDLYQCLWDNVSIYRPGHSEVVTEETFRSKYGINPGQWLTVKAMMGDASDDIPGIKGVGDKIAVKAILNKFAKRPKIMDAIEAGACTIERNTNLMRLPHPRTPIYDLVPDEVTRAKWNAVAERLGMGSLVDASFSSGSRRAI